MMDELQQLYRRALVDQIRMLETARGAALAGDVAATESIRRALHSLRGSGATYGFPEITAAAGAVEAAGDGAPEELDRLIAVLRSVAVAPSPPSTGQGQA